MLCPDGTIKVADFGIARFARSSQQTLTDRRDRFVH
jgi:serine/threonine protein kinase